MKRSFKIYDSRYTIDEQSAGPAALNRKSSIVNRKSQDGVALVITLIMLSVITFMAVTFLVLSQRERNSVTIATDQKIARMAADTSFERVMAELTTRMLLRTNFQDVDLMVSTNYINRAGFNNGLGFLSPTNVNYDYESGGLPYGGGVVELQRNIGSLLYNPRAPVSIITNSGTGEGEFRFYVDLNRNGRFDTNGSAPVISPDLALPYYNGTNGVLEPASFLGNGPVRSNNFTGDPEWIGVLERPEELHSPDNKFIARYAYLVVPMGNSLDINTMHNQSVSRALSTANDGYLRNQGMGPWELNLAAFLTDLNTNEWQIPGNYYNYQLPITGNPNGGASFEDSLRILNYRYGGNYNNLSSANVLFPNGAGTFVTDNGDEYSDGPLMISVTNIDETIPGNQDVVTRPWPGADNPNHFFTLGDFFDRSKTQVGVVPPGAPGFSDRLQWAGGSNDSYNTTTFYRMLSQLGTDSQAEPNKINVNWKNIDASGNVVPGMETNLIPWTPLDFFTNAAHAMFVQLNLRDLNGNLITVTNIPVYEDPTRYGGTNINYYTPAVHRVLQLAANIFDATTNQTVPLLGGQTTAFFPSVFRPYFSSYNGIAYISGFVEETKTVGLDLPFLAKENFALANQSANTVVNLIGVPWVIGAKKGFPNFNYYAVKPEVQMTRKIQVSRANDGDPLTIRQMFNLTITNRATMQAWNSYSAAWPGGSRPLQVTATNIYTLRVLNSTNTPPLIDEITPDVRVMAAGFTTAVWPGFNANFPARSMTNLVLTNYSILGAASPPYAYYSVGPRFLQGTNFETTTIPMPQWYIVTTNHMRFSMVDTLANRVVDFVNLDDGARIFDLTAAMTNNADCVNQYTANTVWCPAPVAGTPFRPRGDLSPGTQLSKGIDAQIHISMGDNPGIWTPTNGNFFLFVMNPANPKGTNETDYNPTYSTNLVTCWQANDPLVHYTIGDLTDLKQLPTSVTVPSITLNHNYQPWNYDSANKDSANTVKNAAKKDPAISGSDSWLFLTNKFANIGMLGRVHRGTSWQTVYLKSPTMSLNDWRTWSGNTSTYTDGNSTNADASFTQPTQDYKLFDLFTTAVSDNAQRGRLNINQTNLAAWSAALSGVSVLTNTSSGLAGVAYIDPAGIYDPTSPPPPLVKIWQGINNARANTNQNRQIFDNHVFQHAGDVLATPELTVASPYINTNANTSARDEVYERIPQQIMSLLTLNQTPRFVIYSYGQTLHPADHSLVVGGTFNGLCTNYQITAETATRAVVRMEGSPDPQYTNGIPPHPDPQGRFYPPHIVVEQFNVIGPE